MAKKRDPWMKFYPTDWRSDPRLRICSAAARGLWLEMMCLMHEAEPYGHLLVSGQRPTDEQLAVLVGLPSNQLPDLLGELDRAGVFSRTAQGTIYSRRMTRDEKRRQNARRNGQFGGNPSLRKQMENPASDNPEDKAPDKLRSQKPDARDPPTPRRGVNGHAKVSRQEVEAAFERFWTAYPRHETKAKAREKLELILKRHEATADQLASAAASYARRMAAEGRPREKIAHPTTWLNQKRWEDEAEFAAEQTFTKPEGMSDERWAELRELARQRQMERQN